jgi:hypothetical protein
MLETDKADLHRKQHPKHIHAIVGHIESLRVPPSDKQHEHIKRDEIDNEHVASPCRHHVEVPERRGKRPGKRSRVNGAHEEVECEQQREDGDAFIVVGTGDGAGDVTRDDGDERGGDEPRPGVPDLAAEGVGDERGVGGEEGRGEDADLADVDGEGERAEEAVEQRRGDHEAREECSAHDASEWVPALGVEPVPELAEAILGEEERGAVVEVGIELVDHGLVAEDGEEADGEGEHVDECQRRDAEQELLLLRLEPQRPERRREEVQRGGRHGGAARRPGTRRSGWVLGFHARLAWGGGGLAWSSFGLDLRSGDGEDDCGESKRR